MRRLSWIAIGLAFGSLSLGDSLNRHERVEQISNQLMCVCGCPHLIGQCGDECGTAPKLLDEIVALVAEGKTDEEIYNIFEAQYGLSVRAVPKAEGFNLLAWVLPFLGLLVGGVVVFAVIKNLTPAVVPDADTGTAADEIHEKYRKLIDEELRQ
jgi:cytochrome c-type biogenesis protein CcmH